MVITANTSLSEKVLTRISNFLSTSKPFDLYVPMYSLTFFEEVTPGFDEILYLVLFDYLLSGDSVALSYSLSFITPKAFVLLRFLNSSSILDRISEYNVFFPSFFPLPTILVLLPLADNVILALSLLSTCE